MAQISNKKHQSVPLVQWYEDLEGPQQKLLQK